MEKGLKKDLLGWLGLSSLFACLLSAGVVFADEFHYRNFIPGERAAGMGGAYTAISDDPSGAFHNPAGLALIIGNKLSVNVNAYHVSDKSYVRVLPRTTGGADDWTLRSSGLVPNFFGIAQKFGPGVVGFSYAVTDSISRHQEQVFYNIKSRLPNRYISRYVININDEDKTYNIGPSYALELSEKLSVGGTLYLHYRSSRIIRNQLVTLDDGQFEWANGYIKNSEYGLKPILGLMLSPVDKVSLGLTLSKVYLFKSDSRIQETYRGISSAGFGINDVNFDILTNKRKRDLPYETKAGIAYFPTRTFLISADLAYYTKTDDYEPVLNGAVGMEYYLRPSIALRSGLFTDFANTPKLKSNQTDQRERVDNYGASFSLSYFTKNSAITVGTVYVYGTGKAQIISGQPDIQNVRTNTISVFLGTSYSY
ncbi:MAG: hypothetical protein RMI51_02850 [Aquificaceae bacterium]|nr:hypothetical protein [Aquificaceae bacterium]